MINAGGSCGQFLFAPFLQRLIQTVGWGSTLGAMALMARAVLPLVGRLTRAPAVVRPLPEPGRGAMHAVRSALKDRSYLLLHLRLSHCVPGHSSAG